MSEESLLALSNFFNDFIGALIPGFILFGGLAFIHLSIHDINALVGSFKSSTIAFLVFSVCFAFGHGLNALCNLCRYVIAWCVKELTAPFEKDATTSKPDAQRSPFYIHLQRIVATELNAEIGTINENHVRSFAMSVSHDAAALGRRFMFLSLLCNGVGTAVAVLAIDYGVCLRFAQYSVANHPNTWPPVVNLVIAGLAVACFLSRGAEFHRRSRHTPIDIAASTLKSKND